MSFLLIHRMKNCQGDRYSALFVIILHSLVYVAHLSLSTKKFLRISAMAFFFFNLGLCLSFMSAANDAKLQLGLRAYRKKPQWGLGLELLEIIAT